MFKVSGKMMCFYYLKNKKTTYNDTGTALHCSSIHNGQRVLEEYRSTTNTNYSIDRRYIYESYVDDAIELRFINMLDTTDDGVLMCNTRGTTICSYSLIRF